MSGGLVMLAAPAATAGNNDEGPDPEANKISLCHRTDAETNPYVNRDGITPSKSGAINGHDKHDGPIWVPGFKAAHDPGTHWGDIIPPFKWYDNKGVEHNYPGMNWTAEGQAIFNRGCKLEDETPPDCTDQQQYPSLAATSNEGGDECLVEPDDPNIDNAECTETGDTTVPSYSRPPDNAIIEYTDVPNATGGVITATIKSAAAADGFKLKASLPAGWTRVSDTVGTYTVTYESPRPCPIDPPGQPTPNDPCGPTNISFTKPDDTDRLNWEKLENGDLTVAPQAGYVFKGNSQLITFELPADSGVACEQVRPTPVTPAVSVLDPCGTANDTYDVTNDIVDGVPRFTTAAVPIAGGLRLTFSAVPGYLIEGSNTFDVIWTDAACSAGVEKIAPTVSFADPTCERLNRAKWSGNLTDLVDYTVSGTPGRGNSVTVTANIKPAVADQFAFADGFVNTFDHSYPSKADLKCATVKGSESSRPKPQKTPTVLGTQAVAPTAVDAGLASLPGDSATSTASLLAQLMVAGGLLLLLAGGWLGLGRRENGAHQA